MSLVRTAWTDDDGSLTTGTILNNAEKTALYDQIDARWSELTTTSTGTQNNFSLVSSTEADVLRCNNATLLTLTGIVAPASPLKPGKRLIIYSVGAGQVNLSHENVSSTAANRFNNIATSAPTSLAAGKGVAVYVYDDGTDRWRLTAHEQGDWISPTFAAGNYTPFSAGTWTVAVGDVLVNNYYQRGRQLSWEVVIDTTTVTQSGGQPTILVVAPAAISPFTITENLVDVCFVDDNNTHQAGVIQYNGANMLVAKFGSTQFAAATDTTGFSYTGTFHIT